MVGVVVLGVRSSSRRGEGTSSPSKPLRQLEAFQHFEDLLRAAVRNPAGTIRKPTVTSPR
jgi:hypothetical protein